MSIESGGDLGSGTSPSGQIGFKLRPAPFADAAEVRGSFHDTEFARCHEPSLPPSRHPVDFKRHHSPECFPSNRNPSSRGSIASTNQPRKQEVRYAAIPCAAFAI